MSRIMNRKLSSGVTIALAVTNIFACSDAITGPNAFTTADIGTDATRIASVAVSLASSSIAVGQTTRATAALLDYQNRVVSRDVSWSSSNPAIATISSDGVVKGIAAGTATITAKRASLTGSAIITVTASTSGSPPAVASVNVSLASSTLNPGQTTQATATTRDA